MLTVDPETRDKAGLDLCGELTSEVATRAAAHAALMDAQSVRGDRRIPVKLELFCARS